jgi:hypothetical protein
MKTIHNWHLNISNDEVESVVFIQKAHLVPCQKENNILPLVKTSVVNCNKL